MPWDPGTYHQFQRERAAPFDDLLALVERRPRLRVIDLGCGTGELTLRLADALPESYTIGVDSSAEMLARAAVHARPSLRFEQRTIESLQSESVKGAYDLVFAHASLQWIEDHEHLIPNLLDLVAPGGQLAVQMPNNHEHPTHVLLRELATEPAFARALGGFVRRPPVLTVATYAELLHRAGGRELVAFEKVYPHQLADADALADWMRGTALVPYLERLVPAEKDELLGRYRERLRARFPEKPVFFGFNRILFAARRPAL